jgi:hypothetical protein
MNEDMDALKAHNDQLYMMLIKVAKSGCLDNDLLASVNNTLDENPITSLKTVKLRAVEFIANLVEDYDKGADSTTLLSIRSFAQLTWGMKD